MKISQKIFFGFLLIILFFFAVIYFVIFPQAVEQFRDSVNISIEKDKEYLISYFEGIKANNKKEIEMISSNDRIIDIVINQEGDYKEELEKVIGESKEFDTTRILLFDKNENIIFDKTSDFIWINSVKSREAIKQGIRNEDVGLKFIYSEGYLSLVAFGEIRYNSNIVGHVMLLKPVYVGNLHEIKGLLKTSEILIRMKDNEILSTVSNQFSSNELNKLKSLGENGNIELNGKNYYYNYFSMMDFKEENIGKLYLLVDSDNFNSKKNAIRRSILVVFVLGIALSFLLASMISLTIIKPINLLKEYIEKMRENNFDFSISESLTERIDEIGFFAKTFEKLKHELLVNQKKVKYYNKELESSYKEMKNYLYIFEVKNKELVDRLKEQEIIKDILNMGIKEASEINIFLKFLLKKIVSYRTFKRAEFVYRNGIDSTYERIVYIPEKDKFIESYYNENLKYLINERPIIKDNYIELPIRVRNEIAGSIKIEEIELNDNVEKTLDIIVNEIEIILENAELYYKMDKRIMELSFLNSISVALSSVNDVEEMKKMIEDSIAVLFGIHKYSLFLYEKGWLVDFKELSGDILKIKRKPVEDIELFILNKYDNVEVNKEYFIPLVVKEKLIGAIKVEKELDFKSLDKNIIKIFLTQISIIIQNTLMYAESRQKSFSIIKSLAQAIEEKDEYTRGHSERVMEYALKIAGKMKLQSDEIEKIIYAGILHDVGKIGIPETILLKAGKLTRDEYDIIKEHPSKGAKILSHIPILRDIVDIVKYHHERWDGKGYPEGLSKTEVPLGARILSLADTFDAMTSDRPYRKGMGIEKSVEELRKNAGTQFDPELTKILLEMIDKEEIKISMHKENV